MRDHRFMVALVVVALFAAACSSTSSAPTSNGGDVTFPMLEKAANDANNCIAELGYDVDPPVYEEDGFVHGFGWASRDDENGQEGLPDDVDQCLQTYYRSTASSWQDAHKAQIDARNRQYAALIVACLQERDINVDELNTDVLNELRSDHPQQLDDCRSRAGDQQDGREPGGSS